MKHQNNKINDEEYKKFVNYFENSSCEKYIKEIKKNIKL